MSNQDNSGLLDIIQERLSNPALFTFAWVYVIYNWQAFGWFLFEPLMFSLKLEKFQETNIEVYFWWPFFTSLAVILLGHGLTNFAEFCKRVWDQLLARALEKLKLKQFVDAKVYTELRDRYINIQSQLRTTQETLDKLEGLQKSNPNNLPPSPDSEADTKPKQKVEELEYNECIAGININEEPVDPNSTVLVPFNKNAQFTIFTYKEYTNRNLSIVVSPYSNSRGAYEESYLSLSNGDEVFDVNVPVELEPVIVSIILNQISVFDGSDIAIEEYRFKLEPITVGTNLLNKEQEKAA